MFLKSKQTATGLDIGSSSVKVVRLMHKGDSLALLGLAVAEIGDVAESDDTAAAEVLAGTEALAGVSDPGDPMTVRGTGEAPDPKREATIEAVRQALEAAGVDARKKCPVVTAISGRHVSVKHVTFPRMTEEELSESIRWEAKRFLPFDVGKAVLGYQILERTDKEDSETMEVLLTAAEKTVVDGHIDILTAAGLEPDVVDIGPLALMNEVAAEGLMNGSAVAALEMGETWANLSVYAEGSLFFSRSIPMPPDIPEAFRVSGLGEVDSSGAASIVAHDPPAWLEAILRAVRFSLTFYDNETKQQGIEAVFLAGGCAMIPGIAEAFETALGLTTRVLNPLETLPLSSDQTDALMQQGPRFALAMGLARRR